MRFSVEVECWAWLLEKWKNRDAYIYGDHCE